jgi:hypothetical protein
MVKSGKAQPEILDIFLKELPVVYMDQGARFSSYGECDVDRLRSISFYSPFFLNQFSIASRLVFSFCEAMAGLLSMTSTAVSSAKVAVTDSGEVAGLQCIAFIIMALGHCFGV